MNKREPKRFTIDDKGMLVRLDPRSVVHAPKQKWTWPVQRAAEPTPPTATAAAFGVTCSREVADAFNEDTARIVSRRAR